MGNIIAKLCVKTLQAKFRIVKKTRKYATTMLAINPLLIVMTL
jgi:hypothetical protein